MPKTAKTAKPKTAKPKAAKPKAAKPKAAKPKAPKPKAPKPKAPKPKAPKPKAPKAKAPKPKAPKAKAPKAKAAPKATRPVYPPDFPILPSDDELMGQEFTARVNCKPATNRKGKVVQRCDRQRVRVVAAAAPSAAHPKRKQVVAVQKGTAFAVSDRQLSRALRVARSECSEYEGRVMRGEPVPPDAYDLCPRLPDAVEPLNGDASFDPTKFNGRKRNAVLRNGPHDEWHYSNWLARRPRRWPDGRVVPIEGDHVIRLGVNGETTRGEVIDPAMTPVRKGQKLLVRYYVMARRPPQKGKKPSPQDLYSEAHTEEINPFWSVIHDGAPYSIDGYSFGSGGYFERLFADAPRWNGPVLGDSRQMSLKMNHHHGAHRRGDPLGVYLPPLAQWGHGVASTGAASRVWTHPVLGWTFDIFPAHGGYFYAQINAGPYWYIGSAESRSGAIAQLRRVYAALPSTEPHAVHDVFSRASGGKHIPRYSAGPLRDGPKPNARPPKGTAPGSTYIPRTPDPMLGERVIGDDFAGEVRAPMVLADGRPGHFVGGHLMTRSRAAAGVRRERIARGEIPKSIRFPQSVKFGTTTIDGFLHYSMTGPAAMIESFYQRYPHKTRDGQRHADGTMTLYTEHEWVAKAARDFFKPRKPFPSELVDLHTGRQTFKRQPEAPGPDYTPTVRRGSVVIRRAPEAPGPSYEPRVRRGSVVIRRAPEVPGPDYTPAVRRAPELPAPRALPEPNVASGYNGGGKWYVTAPAARIEALIQAQPGRFGRSATTEDPASGTMTLFTGSEEARQVAVNWLRGGASSLSGLMYSVEDTGRSFNVSAPRAAIEALTATHARDFPPRTARFVGSQGSVSTSSRKAVGVAERFFAEQCMHREGHGMPTEQCVPKVRGPRAIARLPMPAPEHTAPSRVPMPPPVALARVPMPPPEYTVPMPAPAVTVLSSSDEELLRAMQEELNAAGIKFNGRLRYR